jgi:hypothetical protein
MFTYPFRTSRAASSSSSRRRFVPALESLEGRAVPAAVAAFSIVDGVSVLTITGDNSDETINIHHDGAGGIWANNVLGLPSNNAPPAGPVDKVIVKMKGGDDYVSFTQGSPTSPLTQTQSLSVEVDLGDGADTFAGYLYGAIGRAGFPVQLSLQIASHDGLSGESDTMRVSAGSADPLTGDSPEDLDILPGSTLNLEMLGDYGSDDLRFRYQGELDGKILLHMEGGAGDDEVRADIDLDQGSTGKVGTGSSPATVRGNAGADTLYFVVRKDNPNDLATVTAELDGGLGHDEGTFTANFVDDTSIEEPFRV